MAKRALGIGLIVGLAASGFTGCGEKSTRPATQVGTGVLFSMIGDAPACDILSFRANVTKMTLTPQGSTVEIGVIVSTPSFAPSIKVDFAALRDASTVLNFANIPEGTYDAVTITLTAPQLVVYDPTQDPPIKAVATTLTNASAKISFSPPLVLTKGKVSALKLDFDLLRSVELDLQNQVTGKVTPVFQAKPLPLSATNGFGVLEGLVGFVQRVDTFSSNPTFIGDFQMQLLSGTGPSLLVNLQPSPKTQVFGFTGLNLLPTGSFAEVDGFVDGNANFVAETIEIEDREVVELNKVAFIGTVTSAAYDGNGNVTNFNLYVRDTEPSAGFNVLPDVVVPVSVSSSTVFQYSSRSANFASLVFDPTALSVGQEVVVHGTFTVPPAPPPPTPKPPPSVSAEKVYLKINNILGNFSAPVQAGSDDKTGAFQFAPCGTIFQGKNIWVLTNIQTEFVNVPGLAELTAQPKLLVKGLPFFELNGGTINGVQVPPGTLVMLATEVHQLL